MLQVHLLYLKLFRIFTFYVSYKLLHSYSKAGFSNSRIFVLLCFAFFKNKQTET